MPITSRCLPKTQSPPPEPVEVEPDVLPDVEPVEVEPLVVEPPDVVEVSPEVRTRV